MVKPSELPAQALLKKYRAGGAYTDCYVTSVEGLVSQADYVEAFYTTPLFKLERFILKYLVQRPSSDLEAKHLAKGREDRFAAWFVEERRENQLLLADYRQQTRSWLMVVPQNDLGTSLLYFGSAVVPRLDKNGLPNGMPWAFRPLLGLHKCYSVALLRAAKARLMRQKLSRH